MSYLYTTISYAGLTLDTYLTSDQQTWLTLSSLATGIGVHRQTVKDWLRHHSQPDIHSIDVKVGKFNKAAKAYPVEIAVDFLEYMATRGNKEAKAFLTATVVADIKRSIKEANGILMTAAQHEEARHLTRLELLQQWARKATDNGQVPLSVEAIKEGGFSDVTEREVVYQEGVISRLEVKLRDGGMDREEADAVRYGIKSRQSEIHTLTQSLSN